MPNYTVYWRDGKKEVLNGRSIADAFNRAGYGAGALGALDFYMPGRDKNEHEWNKEKREWQRKVILR